MGARSFGEYLDDEIFCSMWIQGYRPGKSKDLRDFPTYQDKFLKHGGRPAAVCAYVRTYIGDDSRYGMFGRTDPFHKMAHRTRKCFESKNLPVMITGERGSGKEMVARAIRFYGDRKTEPFTELNAARLNGNSELFASHAFGSRKGAFTGAMNKKGAFEIADSGILYLNEVGVLSKNLQPTLLEFFDDYTITPLGENNPIDVDVKVISSTNRDLARLAEEGGFQRDLYDRLKGYVIHVPSLAERRDDIPLLTEVFRRMYSDKYGHKLKIFCSEIDRIQEHSWRGNIRELELFIGRSAVFGELDWESIGDNKPGPVLIGDVADEPCNTWSDEEHKYSD